MSKILDELIEDSQEKLKVYFKSIFMEAYQQGLAKDEIFEDGLEGDLSDYIIPIVEDLEQLRPYIELASATLEWFDTINMISPMKPPKHTQFSLEQLKLIQQIKEQNNAERT